MSILDMRTRTKADIRNIDVADFFGCELPALIVERSHLAIQGAKELGLSSFTFVTPSGAWTVVLSGGGLKVVTGKGGDAEVALSDADLGDFINDLTTLEMLVNLKRMEIVRGSADDRHGWSAVLRSLIDGRPVHTKGSVVMRDREGRNLDIGRSFTPEDDDAEIGQFLAEAGFLHLRDWFNEDLMQAIGGDMDREFAASTRSDGSWWAKLADGSQRPVRISSFAARSPALRRLIASDAYRRIARLTGDGFHHAGEGEAMQKPLQVVSGISSLPWHNDCALGMHSYKCCNLTIGISVTGAGPGSSQLGVLPGSHRALLPTNRLYPDLGLEPRTIATRTGDVTVHCSCTLHMSENPTEYERKVVYTVMELPIDPETSAEVARLQARYQEVGQTYSEEKTAGLAG